MNTRNEMETELKARLRAATNSSLFTSSRLTQLIKGAYRNATSMFRWQDLVKAKCTNTVASQEYYDYPTEFRPLSIFRVEIDGEEYNQKNFEDYLDYKNSHPNSTRRIFADFQGYIFIHPTPTSTGSNNMDVWGRIEATELTSSGSTTIFSYKDIRGNYAVVRLALSTALVTIDDKLSKEEEIIAKGMLMDIFNNQQVDVQRDQRIQHPKFDVPDFFSSSNNDQIGRFDYDPSEVY